MCVRVCITLYKYMFVCHLVVEYSGCVCLFQMALLSSVVSCSRVLVCQLLLEWSSLCVCSTSTGICVGGELVCVCVQLVLEYVWGRVSMGILHGCGEEA